MAIRIDRIKVNRGGPLDTDFDFSPADLNLVYGQNETGKTYIVETLINLLFRTGSRAPVKWNLRQWDLSGRIIVSGLKSAPVHLTKMGTKLEDYWEEGPGLPVDLSRLLVVKAGQTVLAEEEADGVGRGTLKHYLSGEGFLDKIVDRISSTMRGTTVEDRLIDGAQRGEVKTRNQREERLNKLNKLIRDVEKDYASGEVYTLHRKNLEVEAELKRLEKAKRYHTSQLYKNLQVLRLERETLPAEHELSKVESEISIHESKKNELEAKATALERLEGTNADYRWADSALNDYSEIISGGVGPGPNPMFILFAVLFFIGAVVTGLFGLPIPLIVCAVGALAFFIPYYMGMRNALAKAGPSRELENLKAEFSKRFGCDLTNRALFQARVEELKENHIRATALKEEVDKLTLDTTSLKNAITETLNVFTGTELPPENWREMIRETRKGIRKLDDKMSSLDRTLASLGVSEGEYLDDDIGIEWDADRFKSLQEELAKNRTVLDTEMKRLDLLRSLIAQETGTKSTEWEDLMTDLRDKREEAAEEYRQITAEILAKVQVKTAIEEFREEENTRIANGLKRHEFTKPLHALTGNYCRLRQEPDTGLVLATNEDEEFRLSHISTGAQEQIFLALRMGFASIAMEGQTAFLILDDAFQHSDWHRREKLTAEILGMVKTGWQVFYFTMDDHIRDLFLEAGEPMGARFKIEELH